MRFCYFFCFFPVGNPWLTRSTWSQKKVNLDYHSTLHHWVTTQEMSQTSQMSLPVWFLDVFLTNSTLDVRTLFAASVHYPSCKESRRFGKAEVSLRRWCQNVSKFPKYWLRCITQPCRSLVLPGSTASVQPSRAFQSLPILRRLVWFQHVVNTVPTSYTVMHVFRHSWPLQMCGVPKLMSIPQSNELTSERKPRRCENYAIRYLQIWRGQSLSLQVTSFLLLSECKLCHYVHSLSASFLGSESVLFAEALTPHVVLRQRWIPVNSNELIVVSKHT